MGIGTKRALALALALSLVSTVSPAVAQVSAAANAGVPGQPSAAAREDQLETRIMELHARLKITPAQEPLWTAFTKVMRDNAAAMGEVYRNGGDMRTMPAPAALNQYAKISQAQADGIKNLTAPFQALYDSMDAGQKKSADEAFRNYRANALRRRR